MTQIYLHLYLPILQMNSLKIGIELKKLVYKKKLGQGEFSYVSVESKSEALAAELAGIEPAAVVLCRLDSVISATSANKNC